MLGFLLCQKKRGIIEKFPSFWVRKKEGNRIIYVYTGTDIRGNPGGALPLVSIPGEKKGKKRGEKKEGNRKKEDLESISNQ